MGSSEVAEAKDLLQRREEELMGFEQFVFPFVALVHRKGDTTLTARRLEICRAHFAAGKQTGDTLGGGGRSVGLSTCVAAGFVAAAFARCLGGGDSSLSPLLCQ